MRKSKVKNKIIQILKNSDHLLTVQEIHKQLSDTDLATVYRNVNKLVELNEVSELRIKKGESLFEVNSDNHQHVVCNVCGKVEHVKIDTKNLLKQLNISDFEIEDIEITIKGRCKK